MTDQGRGWWRLLAALLTLSLLAAACGSDDEGDGDAEDDDGETAAESSDDDAGTDDSDSDSDDDATAAGGEPELSEVRLGLIPIADVAPIFIAIEEGYFEEEGLTVTTEYAQGGAAAIPATIAGDIDFAFGAYPSFFSAVQEGLPLLIATEANRAAPDFAGLYSMPDSGIESPEDMVGKTVAVNTLNNIVQMAVEVHLKEAGLSLDDVTLVEIPFPDQVAALERGDVDVISVVEPFSSMAESNLEANLVVDMFSGPIGDFPVAGFFVTQEFYDTNPNTVAAFLRAFERAVEDANSNEDAVPEILPTYIETATVESARGLDYPQFVSGVDVEFLQKTPDFMVDAGLLDDDIDVSEHVVN